MNYTVLVNKKNKWKESYLKKTNWVETKDVEGNTILVEKETNQAFQELKRLLQEEKIEIGIRSGYRDIESQKEWIKEGSQEAKKQIAEPSFSEHHTGLALDIMIKEKDDCFTEKDLERVYPFLKECGFILRYPKGKEEITGYQYHPAHIRFVGKIPAKIIMEKNWTLEEYLEKFCAVLYVNKPQGMTSFDVVKKISNLFGIKKVGHTGTLDPLATGVMIVAVGKATKIVELLTAEDKEYIASAQLGIQTDTYDITGEVIEEKEVLKDYPLDKVLKSFQKTYLQEVPIFSATKVNGKKLYEYAREKKEVTLPKKEVTIKEISLENQTNNQFTFKAKVSKGCYIRSLIHEIGQSLDIGATMTSLQRTKQGKISIEMTDTLEDIEKGLFTIHSIEEVLDYPVIKVEEEIQKKIMHGMKLEDYWNIKEKVIFQTKEGKLLGIYEKENNTLQVYKNFC